MIPQELPVTSAADRDKIKHDKAVALAGDMALRFERHFGQSWTDPQWAGEASVWAAAWKAASLPPIAAVEDSVPQLPAAADAAREESPPEAPHDGRCRKCGGPMIQGQALAQTFYTGREGTCSPAGPGALIPCLKCADCGWSVTSP